MDRYEAAGGTTAERPLWRRSLAWLLFLAPFFFLSYGFANHMAAERGAAPTFVFDWEQRIPFVPWTILPYWSIDPLYGLSFLLCRDRRQVDTHALRLLTAQLISVTAFLLFPLQYSFERPATDGVFGAMFEALEGFDRPYNQAPSLHISLLVILWARFAGSIAGPGRLLVHVWAALIGVSVLTTYQHHFIDVPTGALVGLLCVWLWPDHGASPLAGRQQPLTRHHRQLTARYLLGASVLALAAALIGGCALWLWWGTVALSLVAIAYAWAGGAASFQKRDGALSLAARLLFAPYLVGVWLNSRCWTHRDPTPSAIVDGVWLGRMPTAKDMHAGHFSVLCDLSAELPAPRGDWRYTGLAWLDMVPPSTAQLAEAAQLVESLRAHGPVLVCCALGYSRSACAVLAWLIVSGRARDVAAAEALLRRTRPQIVLSPAHRAALAELVPGGEHMSISMATAAERARIIAAGLATGRSLDRWSLASMLAVLLLLGILPGPSSLLATGCFVLSILAAGAQKIVGLGVAFDEALFRDWAGIWSARAAQIGDETTIAQDMAALDQTLVACELLPAQGDAVRGLTSRLQGALGMLKMQALALAIQVAAMVGTVMLHQ
ncbi:MAG: phosphatase PAP2/dual specificity phosphatase family protein [Pseudomonadota bacterium]